MTIEINETFQRRIERVAGFNSRVDGSLAALESGGFFQRKEFEARQARHKMMIARDEAKKAARRSRMFVWERHGGIRFWKIGRLGGSFYIAKR